MHMCVNNFPRVAFGSDSRDSNPQPVDRKSDFLTRVGSVLVVGKCIRRQWLSNPNMVIMPDKADSRPATFPPHNGFGWPIYGLRSATSSQLDVRPSRLVTVGDRSFASVGPRSGTVSPMTSHRPHRCQYSERNWKHTYFGNHIRMLFSSLLWFFCRHRGPWS